MRRILPALLVLATVVALRAADVEFVRIWPGWRPADYFQRISEYFTDVENPGDAIVVRSRPSSRSGYYFLARVKHPRVALRGAAFVLQVITPSDPEAKTFTFPADCPPGSHLFDLGLTGADWSGRAVHPVAWKLALVAKDGTVLAARQSFLWAKPGK